MPCRSGTAPSVRPVPPERGTTGIPNRLAIRTTSATSSVLPGSTTASGMCSAQRWTGNGAGTRARWSRAALAVITRSAPSDLRQRLERAVVETAGGDGAHALRLPPTSIPSDSASSSWMSTTSISRRAPAGTAAVPTRGMRSTSVSISSWAACSSRRSLIFAVSSGFSTGSPAPPPEQ